MGGWSATPVGCPTTFGLLSVSVSVSVSVPVPVPVPGAGAISGLWASVCRLLRWPGRSLSRQGSEPVLPGGEGGPVGCDVWSMLLDAGNVPAPWHHPFGGCMPLWHVDDLNAYAACDYACWTVSRIAEYFGYRGVSVTASARKQMACWGLRREAGGRPGRGKAFMRPTGYKPPTASGRAGDATTRPVEFASECPPAPAPRAATIIQAATAHHRRQAPTRQPLSHLEGSS